MLVMAALPLMPAPAIAAINVQLAPPAATFNGYAFPDMIVSDAADALFTNLDRLAPHNIQSVDLDRDGEPLFATPLIVAGETAVIEGLSELEPGTYRFACKTHSDTMFGTMTVIEP